PGGRPGRLGPHGIDRTDVADGARLDEFANALETRQGPTIEGDPQWHARVLAGRDHRSTLGDVDSHRLLDVDGLARRCGPAGVFGVGVRVRCDVDRVDVRGL